MTCSYIVYQAAVENRDDLHASEEDLALVGQDVEDGQELPNSQQQEEELPELSASTVVQTGGQGVEESRPAVVHVLVRVDLNDGSLPFHRRTNG